MVDGHVKPRLLDLFCGAGGAAMGYHRAGFEVVGVDIAPQPNYPFAFVQGDALDVVKTGRGLPGGSYHAIHASPPCQAHSTLARMWNARADHPDLIAETRELLHATGLPYVIENVVGAPLLEPVMICGSSVGLPLLQRHRLFETNFPLMVPPCAHNQGAKRFPALDAEGRRNGGMSSIVGVYGHGGDKRADLWPEAMGIDWMTRHELTQSIPPAYTELIGHQLLAHLKANVAA
jgi:DNA (cytosine-5)-methyltransferase 1